MALSLTLITWLSRLTTATQINLSSHTTYTSCPQTHNITPQSVPPPTIIRYLIHTYNKATQSHFILSNIPKVPLHTTNQASHSDIHKPTSTIVPLNTTTDIGSTHDINPQPVIPTSPWTHYIIYIHHKVTHLHFNPHLISSNVPIIFNDTYIPNLTSTIYLTNTITAIGNIYYIPHIHQKTPKIKIIKYYNSILLLQHGDVEPHPGPSSKILKTLPQEYTRYLK